jgi:general secretion pathway protein J
MRVTQTRSGNGLGRSSRGFTLLEVMVAMVLMALFAVAGYRALESVLAAERHAGGELQRWHTLASAFARIGGDLGSLVPNVAAAPGEVRGLRLAVDSEQRVELAWDRLLPRDQAGGIKRVGYRFHDGGVYRLTWPESVANSVANNVVDSAEELRVLTGVSKLSVRALDDKNVWQTRWPLPGAGEAPRAVEWLFELNDGTRLRRVWLVR